MIALILKGDTAVSERAAQCRWRNEIVANSRQRVAGVVRDDGMFDREPALRDRVDVHR